MREMTKLNGKTVLITGAGAGFGAAMAERFAMEGANIVIADINLKKAQQIADRIGKQAIAVQCDVSRLEDNHIMVEETVKKFKTIDVFIANAGFTHRQNPLEKVDEDTFDLVNAVNIKGLYFGIQSILPVMERQKSGAILTMSATSVIRPRKGFTWFTASKGWIITATRAMALELAEKNIRINCLCPAESDTETFQQSVGHMSHETRIILERSIPLGRLSNPEDIANAAIFLCSDAASFITGTVLPIDGGYHL